MNEDLWTSRPKCITLPLKRSSSEIEICTAVAGIIYHNRHPRQRQSHGVFSYCLGLEEDQRRCDLKKTQTPAGTKRTHTAKGGAAIHLPPIEAGVSLRREPMNLNKMQQLTAQHKEEAAHHGRRGRGSCRRRQTGSAPWGCPRALAPGAQNEGCSGVRPRSQHPRYLGGKPVDTAAFAGV